MFFGIKKLQHLTRFKYEDIDLEWKDIRKHTQTIRYIHRKQTWKWICKMVSHLDKRIVSRLFSSAVDVVKVSRRTSLILMTHVGKFCGYDYMVVVHRRACQWDTHGRKKKYQTRKSRSSSHGSVTSREAKVWEREARVRETFRPCIFYVLPKTFTLHAISLASFLSLYPLCSYFMKGGKIEGNWKRRWV